MEAAIEFCNNSNGKYKYVMVSEGFIFDDHSKPGWIEY